MRVTVNPEMSCEVTLQEEGMSTQEGAFVDLKKYPERISELHEAQVWEAFGEFIQGVNRLRDLRTSGSKADGDTPGGYADPFVDVTFADTSLSRSADVALALLQQFEILNDVMIAGDLEIEVCESYGCFPGGEEACSTRIWLRGTREQAEQAFPVLLGFLAAQSAALYRPLVGRDERPAVRITVQDFETVHVTVVGGPGDGDCFPMEFRGDRWVWKNVELTDQCVIIDGEEYPIDRAVPLIADVSHKGKRFVITE